LFSCLAACKKNASQHGPVITGFSPSKGAGGIDVTINGHFDSTQQQLAVYFNGTQGTVYSSSDSQIIVFAPSGVTTGKIKVTVNNLSATTDSDFVVLAGTWTEMARLPLGPNAAAGRRLGVGFAIGSYGYMGLGDDGNSDYSDLYQYDPGSNSWTKKSSLGYSLNSLVSMVLGDKAYLGIGERADLDADIAQFFEYDPSTDTWTEKGDFPGMARETAFSFSIGGLGYVALGYNRTSSANLYDVWQYDPSTDVWTQKANFPGTSGNNYPVLGTAFSPDNKVAYVVGGANSNLSTKVVWRYDPASDSWTQMHNLPADEMLYPSSMVVNGTAYVLGGGQECWKYDQASDSWTQLAFYGYRLAGSTFSINGKGYFGMGKDQFAILQYVDLWQFTP
jgi:N-acetylneuraminic acid mutarotase